MLCGRAPCMRWAAHLTTVQTVCSVVRLCALKRPQNTDDTWGIKVHFAEASGSTHFRRVMTTADVRSNGLSPHAGPVYILGLCILLCTEPYQGAVHARRSNLQVAAFRTVAGAYRLPSVRVYHTLAGEIASLGSNRPAMLRTALRSWSCKVHLNGDPIYFIAEVMRAPTAVHQSRRTSACCVHRIHT